MTNHVLHVITYTAKYLIHAYCLHPDISKIGLIISNLKGEINTAENLNPPAGANAGGGNAVDLRKIINDKL